ncbi:MoaB/Mog domain-containing protein [Abortiporus biennis]|nr:MoaB/Mog domain-containing protein [Abortiporus biennis]
MQPRATARLFALSRQLNRRPIPSVCLRTRTMSSTNANTVSAEPTATESKPEPVYSFPLSDIPRNPLGEGNFIKTAACLIIGDEILNGKTLDRNSNYFARYCFEQGIELKRIEVIADDEEEMCVTFDFTFYHLLILIEGYHSIEASRRMVQNYDFVITSGGIGPTHDDITYASLAKSFNQGLVHHQETLRRMAEMSKYRWASLAQQNEEQRTARERMALFPDKAEVLFVAPDLWVPVIRLEGKLCIFPGIPRLFQRMLTSLTPFLPLPPPHLRPFRQQVFTSQPESSIAPYLTELQAKYKEQGIRIGSYPLLSHGVYVSIIGQDSETVQGIGKDVAAALDGRLVTDDEAREMAKQKEKGAV